MTRTGRLGVRTALGLAAVGMLAAATPAAAVTSCDYSASEKRLTVTMNEMDDRASIEVADGGEILVRGTVDSSTCTGTGGPPTVNNTDEIVGLNQPGASLTIFEILGAGRFAPGATVEAAENGGTPEIEIDLQDQSVVVVTTSAGDAMRLGTAGINPNANATEVEPDADIFIDASGTDVLGTDGPDVISAQGGLGTGGPITDLTGWATGGGDDVVVGGDVQDVIDTGTGDDTIHGMGGPDYISPGLAAPVTSDDDTIDGGADSDTLTYFGDEVSGVTVDLARAGPQETGAGGTDSLSSIENVHGSEGADVIRGDDGANELYAYGGDDTIEGRGGSDTLDGRDGDDLLEARDGGFDRTWCGRGTDTVIADTADTYITDCETTLFPAEDAGADSISPAFVGKPSAEPRRFEVAKQGSAEEPARFAKRGTTFHFNLSEPATVSFTVERRRQGRVVEGKCVSKTQKNTDRDHCPLFKRVGAFRVFAAAGENAPSFSGRLGTKALHPGPYRTLLYATDAAGNVSAPARLGFRVLD